MDRIFEAQEAQAYEDWLETRAGLAYQAASNRLLDRVLDYRPGWRVLDVGCGLGVHLRHLRERGLVCFGLEAGPVTARVAQQRLGSQVEVEVGDAHDLPYEDNAFDAAILVNTLELVDRPAQALSEAARVAQGRVCLITLNLLSWANLSRRLHPGFHPLRGGHTLSLWGLRQLVRSVLGPAPQAWSAAQLWPRHQPGPWVWGGLVGVCAAVTPRLRTRPLTVTAGARHAAQPAHSHGRLTVAPRGEGS